jgi:hypothetical protein
MYADVGPSSGQKGNFGFGGSSEAAMGGGGGRSDPLACK